MKTKRKTAKIQYTVLAPPYFGLAEIGKIIANEETSIIGRTVETTLYNITNDISQIHIKLRFRIIKVDNVKAYTVFYGHELTRDYVRHLIRRGLSLIRGIASVETKDNWKLRVTCMAVTAHRCQTSQKKAIRKIMMNIINQKSQQCNVDEFVQQMILGKIASEITNEARKLYPLRRVEIQKSKVIKLHELQAETVNYLNILHT
jgi:small subunit ribosomal protein S3Ae